MGKREDYVFNDELVKEIKAMIRSKRSARHVPAKARPPLLSCRLNHVANYW